MAVRVKRGTGHVVLTIGPNWDELTPTEARAVARRLVDAARDVERQVPTLGWTAGRWNRFTSRTCAAQHMSAIMEPRQGLTRRSTPCR